VTLENYRHLIIKKTQQNKTERRTLSPASGLLCFFGKLKQSELILTPFIVVPELLHLAF